MNKIKAILLLLLMIIISPLILFGVRAAFSTKYKTIPEEFQDIKMGLLVAVDGIKYGAKSKYWAK